MKFKTKTKANNLNPEYDEVNNRPTFWFFCSEPTDTFWFFCGKPTSHFGSFVRTGTFAALGAPRSAGGSVEQCYDLELASC